jgi:hypothetical protein
MAEHETAIRIWRDGLTEHKRDSWNSPTSICNRCPTVRKAIAEAKAAAAARAAAAGKPPRRTRTVNRPAAVEKAIDLIDDYMRGLDDADLRASLAERLIGIAKRKPEPEPEPTPPLPAKAKAKKAEAVAKADPAKPETTAPNYAAIAQRYLPKGYRVEYRKALTGMHFGNRKLIKAPRPTTPKSLYVFLHECAHGHLGHSHNGKTPRHTEEMEAERWAHAKMAENGIAVPPEYTERAKRYVAQKIVQAERRGGKNIDPQAIAYAGSHLEEVRAIYEKALGPGKIRLKAAAKATTSKPGPD